MSDKYIFGYGFLPRSFTVFVEQRGARFNLLLGRADMLGLQATKRPILPTKRPRSGAAFYVF
jgi:hypothetical protein